MAWKDALRASAEGEACTVWLPGCLGSERVFLCHIRRPWNAGTGKKPPDLHGFYGCDHCHALIDRRAGKLTQAEIDAAQLDAHLRTLDRMREKGLV